MDDPTRTPTLRQIAEYLESTVGPRMTAAIAGTPDIERIGRYAREQGEQPEPTEERRLRAGYHAVKTMVDSYDTQTARVWLFGTNASLGDRAPIEVLGQASETTDLSAVVEAARQIGDPNL